MALIKWFVLIILVLAIILFIRVAIESKSKRRNTKDPQRHYNKVSGDVINAEYTEKEIDE